MSERILGALRTADGAGVLQMRDRFDAEADDLWSALTDPARLARWYGEIDGELRVGGEHRLRVFASGWEGTGIIEVCEPPHRLVVRSRMDGESMEDVLEVTLTPDGGGTVLVLEQRGLPIDQLPAYGAGTQVHVEDLAAHLGGNERCDATARWNELIAGYRDLEVAPA
jgi:uncharacterized protein YndB with AHSA1/START domain